MKIRPTKNPTAAKDPAAGSFSSGQHKRKTRLQRFGRFYRDLAVILLNTVVLLLAINILLLIAFVIKDSLQAKRPEAWHKPVASGRWAALEKVYPGFGRDEIQDLLDETYSPARSFVYEPYTEFKERPYAGKYVNVDVNGFRLTKGQGPWPPDRERYCNIFLFGGSTAFGFGVSDEETIASHLQTVLSQSGISKEVRVYNFGRGSYYSTQERILFEKLVEAGFRPDVAVFIDGLNDSHHYDDKPSSASRIEGAFEGRPVVDTNILSRVPMVRAASAVGRWLDPDRNDALTPASAETAQDREACGDTAVLQGVVSHYVENKKMVENVAAAYGVKTLFVWQPVAVYKYDQKHNLFADDEHPRKACVDGVYSLMSKFVEQYPLGNEFLWAADMQENLAEPLYVDPLHYSGKMSKLLARSLVDAMGQRSLLPTRGR